MRWYHWLATWFILFCFMLMMSDAESATLNARSCERSEVRGQADKAKDGDTVVIPKGECRWSAPIEVRNKALWVRGQGWDKTRIIIDGKKRDGLSFRCDQTVHGIRVSGIGFLNIPDDRKSENRGLALRGKCRDYQVHDNRFKGFSHAGIYAQATLSGGFQTGVIYKNLFEDIWDPINRRGYGTEVVGDGESAWNRWPLKDPPVVPPEDGDMVYMEDNIYDMMKHPVASNNGARYVFRHNLIKEARQDAASIDAHGNTRKGSSWWWGTRQYMIYNNQSRISERHWSCVGIRGGDGVIYDNFCQKENLEIRLWNEHTNPDAGYKCTYPCPFQIRALYIWDNTRDGGTPARVGLWKPEYEKVLKEGRDYHLKKLAGYTPYPYPHPLRGDGEPDPGPPPLGETTVQLIVRICQGDVCLDHVLREGGEALETGLIPELKGP